MTGTISLKSLSDFAVREPSAEEMRQVGKAWYARSGFTFIDQWPQHLRDLSFPTKLIEVDPSAMRSLWDEGDGPEADRLAAELDSQMGWRNWFVRLNSRSPKDASHPIAPYTCSGKQAVFWITASERCLDDTCLFYHSQKPMYIALREFHYMEKDGEVRCFAKDGKVIGASRYFYNEPAGMEAPAKWLDAANEFYRKNLTEFPDIVFDLYAPGSGDHERLIEINPYGLSDPCLFGSYAELEKNGGFRWSEAERTAS